MEKNLWRVQYVDIGVTIHHVQVNLALLKLCLLFFLVELNVIVFSLALSVLL